jgi:hypothetical protein
VPVQGEVWQFEKKCEQKLLGNPEVCQRTGTFGGKPAPVTQGQVEAEASRIQTGSGKFVSSDFRINSTDQQ